MLSPVFLLTFHWTMSNSFTTAAWLERGRTLFASTELADMVRRICFGYTLSRWRSLCPFPDTLLHPLAKWSVEPQLKQWSQFSTPAILHELHCRRRNCDWLPYAWGHVEFLSTGTLTLSKASFKEARFDCTASNGTCYSHSGVFDLNLVWFGYLKGKQFQPG